MSAFTLDAYAARSCPVKTHNLFDPTIPRPESPDESLGEAFHGGRVFEQLVLDQVASLAEGVTDLRQLVHAPWEVREAACTEAMERGDAVILGGVLPIDLEGHRSGSPDMLVRGADAAPGSPGYRPVEAKLQRLLERRPGNLSQQVSRLGDPRLSASVVAADTAVRAAKDRTLLQMVHYWRLLEACGHASGDRPIAGVIGEDHLPKFGSEYIITWVDLNDRMLRTFSRTSAQGWLLRSPLERYDHEHRFRVHVAESARHRTGAVDPPPVVVPIVVRECDHCVWWERCRTQLDDEAISLRINKSPLDVREISALSSLGVSTITDLAGVDLGGLLPRYLPEVRHRQGAESRLRLAAHRARLLLSGILIERTSTGPIPLPSPRIEIDFDIETSEDSRTYLWGLLVTDRKTGESTYREFSRFEQLTKAREATLLEDFARYLVDVLHTTDAMVYHYSDYERVFLARLAKASSNPAVADLLALADERFVDLFDIVKQHFFGTHGLGLKVVARAGPGFTWRDDDPGGLNSQRWFHDAIYADDERERAIARRRVLEYNEDDVRATKALRNWLRSLS